MEPYNRRWIKLFSIIEKSLKPIIAAVNGFATGGGTEMSLACDFVVASDTAKFGLAEINIGVIPGGRCSGPINEVGWTACAKEICLAGKLRVMKRSHWVCTNATGKTKRKRKKML